MSFDMLNSKYTCTSCRFRSRQPTSITEQLLNLQLHLSFDMSLPPLPESSRASHETAASLLAIASYALMEEPNDTFSMLYVVGHIYRQ